MAPPGYKPLTSAGGITGAPGLPAEIFAPPADVSFDQTLAIQAQLRAQELNNQRAEMQRQSEEIALAERQRAVDEQAQIRDAISRTFTPIGQGGSETGAMVPDTLGGGTIDDKFDPTQTFDAVKRILGQQGNLDGMLAVERATKERASGQPLSSSTLDLFGNELGYRPPEGTTLQDISTLATLKGKNLYGQSLEDNRTKREEDKSSLLPDGFEGNPTKKDSEIFKTAYVESRKVQDTLDKLEASVARTGNNQMSGADYLEQKQLVGNLASIMKGPSFLNLGASMSQGEAAFLATQLPVLMSTPGSDIRQILTEQGFGRDPVDAIRNLKRQIESNVQIEGEGRNIYKRGTREKSVDVGSEVDTSFDPGFKTSPTMIPKVSPSSNTNRSAEEQAYKEKYKATLRAQRGVSGS